MEAIELALASLGDTPDAVAATLRAAGVNGRRNSPSIENILTRYLNRTVDIGGRLEVAASSEVLFLYRNGTAVSFLIPVPVREFLAAFHQGEYPDLEQRRSGT